MGKPRQLTTSYALQAAFDRVLIRIQIQLTSGGSTRTLIHLLTVGHRKPGKFQRTESELGLLKAIIPFPSDLPSSGRAEGTCAVKLLGSIRGKRCRDDLANVLFDWREESSHWMGPDDIIATKESDLIKPFHPFCIQIYAVLHTWIAYLIEKSDDPPELAWLQTLYTRLAGCIKQHNRTWVRIMRELSQLA